jgi:hypothetical protein
MSTVMKRILLETMTKEEMAAELEEIFFDTRGSSVIGKTKKMKQAMDYFWDYKVRRLQCSRVTRRDPPFVTAGVRRGQDTGGGL